MRFSNEALSFTQSVKLKSSQYSITHLVFSLKTQFKLAFVLTHCICTMWHISMGICLVNKEYLKAAKTIIIIIQTSDLI